MHQIPLNEGGENASSQASQMFYMFSDGFQDQFGGKHDEKYKSKRFRNFLHTISYMPVHLQISQLAQEFETWKGEEEQTDDVLVIGIRL